MSLKDLGISKQEAWIVLVLGVGLGVGFVARPLDEYLFTSDRSKFIRSIQQSEKQFSVRSAEIEKNALAADSVGREALVPGGGKTGKRHTVLSGPVDLNSAKSDNLVLIPGIGPKTAARIIDYRNKFGPFASIEDLLKVKGIGKKTLEKIKPFIEITY